MTINELACYNITRNGVDAFDASEPDARCFLKSGLDRGSKIRYKYVGEGPNFVREVHRITSKN